MSAAPRRLRLSPLGGVGRFGRNCLCVELEGGPALLVDCGVRFVADEAPGFDVGLPDLERIDALGERLLGIVLTHGHEDHIGGLPYVTRRVPLFATAFTRHLIERRFARMELTPPDVDVVALGDSRALGPFRVTWLAVSHSIPDASCLVIETPAGTLVHSGDFRVDDDPVLGPHTDLDGLARVGDAGVACLLADSTGAQIPGRNPGERSVHAGLLAAVRESQGRAFVALFASHIQRLALLGDVCRETKRRLVLLGAGLKESAKAAQELGLFHIDDVLLSVEDAGNFPRDRLVFGVTGSQGEPQSALARLASDELFGAKVEPGDRVILSARVIPGNERKVIDVVEALADRGADIVDGRNAPHVSGHGYAGDLELLLAATRPRAFVALHGNARNLLANGDLARKAGLHADNVVELRDGGTLLLGGDGDGDDSLEHLPGVRAHEPMASYGALEMFPQGIVRARKRMAAAGFLVVDLDAGKIAIEHAISPALDDELRRLILETALSSALAQDAGSGGAPEKAVGRLFWKRRRAPPEIVVLRTA